MYLYIQEDGTFKQSNNLPTQEDLDCIESGILSVIWYGPLNPGADHLFLQAESDGSWTPVETF